MSLFRSFSLFSPYVLTSVIFYGFGQALAAEVVINEIMFHPAHADETAEPSAEEYIELHNTDPNNPVSLTDWSFTNGVRYSFSELSIPANGFLIVSADPVAFAAKYPSVSSLVVGPWTGRLSNSGERIRLADASGEQVDEVKYTDDGDWAKRRRGPLDFDHRGWVWDNPADQEGASLELINPSLTNKSGQNWTSSSLLGGSPGEGNSAAASDIAPLISKVGHHPLIPSSSDLVRIRAELRDEGLSGLSATVYYRVSESSPGPFTSLAMFDDGQHDDELAEDQVFAAFLPAQPNGEVIEFYLESSDGVNTRTWPGATDASGTQGANALYLVDDEAERSEQSIYQLILSVPEELEFRASNFNSSSNAQMNTTFIVTNGEESEVRYQGGLRRRGAGSRSARPRTMRLNLPQEDSWDDITDFNLNARYGFMQVFGQQLFTASCLPAQEGRNVQVLLDGSNQADDSDSMYGSYAHMEPTDGTAISRLFPEDDGGNVYRKRRPKVDLAYRSGSVTSYLEDGWTKETNSSLWDWSDLDQLLQALNDTSSPDYFSNVDAIVNIEQWLRWFAVMTLLNNGETNLSNGVDDDFYMYRPDDDPRFQLIPHDLDTILGIGDSDAIHDTENSIFDMFDGDEGIPVLEDFILHPNILPRYYGHLQNLLETSFSKSAFDAFLEERLNFIPASERTEIVAYMDQRRLFVLSEIENASAVTLPINGCANAQELIKSLRITELMYHPDDEAGSEFEFAELQNTGAVPLDLTGVFFADGIDFEFPALTLAPKEYILVVSNISAFESKYGSGLPIAGEYSGQLSNGGERIILQSPDSNNEVIQDFSYDDAWIPATDGSGYSLEIIDATGPQGGWELAASWQLGDLQGTPAYSRGPILAGPDQTVVYPERVLMSGEDASASMSNLAWSQVSGAGEALFDDPSLGNSGVAFTLPGTYVLRLTGTDSIETFLDEVIITVDDSYEGWRARQEVAGGPLDNDDGDEFSNLLEYAFELDPLSFESGSLSLPQPHGEQAEIVSLQYPRKSDIIVTLYSSTNLQDWEAATPTSVDDTHDEKLFRYTVLLTTTSEQFFRFGVSLIP